MQFTPHILNKIVWTLFFLFVAGYLTYTASHIYLPSKFEVLEPENNLITSQTSVMLKAKIDSNVRLTVNEEVLYADKDGNFEKRINLAQGVNFINIKVENRFGRVNEKILKVVRE